MTDMTMTCERLDTVLGAYLEETLEAPVRSAAEAHLGECLRCAALVRDIEAIRRDAANLPELTPARDLWSGIADRIAAPVIKLQPREVSGAPRDRFLRAAMAAAILIAVTAGVTYTLTVRQRGPDVATRVAPGVRSPEPGVAVTPDSPLLPAPSVPGAQPSALAVSAARRDVPAVVTYDREIAALRGVLDLRRNDLDPATLAVVENSLMTIDRAIADARAAVARDSASAFLHDQLNKALEKKLGVLRTVALLPPRA